MINWTKLTDLKYAEISKANAKLINWSQVYQNSWDTAIWNDDSTACIVSWIGDTPATIAALKGVKTRSHKNLCDKIKIPGDKFRGRGAVPSKKK
tara:strand:+ start:757 stop:1038 length:282 start_codon:yes stop_codon:yes gene_type:complete